MATHPKGKLCLNMIVKNESRIIERLLESVLPIIDTYCICDTGSTDDTAEIIRQFMEKANKPGIVFSEPFQNFGYNRTVALERAADWGDYALLLDADMKLIISPSFDKAALAGPGYNILQKNGGMEYYNTRIVKTGIGIKCLGPTHEYYSFPPGVAGPARLTTLHIDDIGDGGCKADKFERDIRLLTEGLKEEPTNARYHFYIANSYKNTRNYTEAIRWYKRRIELGGWAEEVFYSCYEIGNCYKSLDDLPSAVYWWLEAYNRRPTRAESLYEVVKHYRETSRHHAAQLLCDAARKIPFPADDLLFIKKPVYDYLLNYEHSILAYYTKTPIDHYMYLRLLGTGYNRHNVMGNYRYYAKKLVTFPHTLLNVGGGVNVVVGGREDTFTSSSPSLIPYESQGAPVYLLNVRYVNYNLHDNGGYSFRHDDGKITTINRRDLLSKDLKVLSSTWIDKVHDESLRYQGVEDVKLFNHKGQVHFFGTVQNSVDDRLTIGHGIYEGNCLQPTPIPSPYQKSCEKNWAMCHNAAGDMRVIYEWSPLTIGKLQDDQLIVLEKNTEVPPFFHDVRGSSNGCTVGDEIWFLCHVVHYATPRHYYHIIVVLDRNTLTVRRHSILFKFHGDPIEYSLGLIVEDERVLIPYSRMDRTSAIMVVPRSVVEYELFAPYGQHTGQS